ncbi:MAG: TonB-dependent receptor [Bacteroidales bacterium]|nr:TonB-dependent receptor [Bacteroidales bacterium]
MKRFNLFLSQLVLLVLISTSLLAQHKRTDANIVGHVVDTEGDHVPFVTIVLKNTTIGAATDETGHFNLINMPVGNFTVVASALGYKPEYRDVELKEGNTIELKFTLEQDVLGLEQVVVTADRNDKHRTDASVIVNTITPRIFDVANTATISEGLNFCPGLRTENNCQNCGFTQVRMNGMEGPYSQILINSRPIFSGLAGVYGLELIPSSMIERMEVIRGGGSALYGSNAVAGTINLILKDPINNSYEASVSSGYTGVGLENSGNPSFNYNINFNTSLVSSDSKTGMALYGYNRDQEAFDVNNDGFSEITEINNITLGTRIFHRIGYRNKIAVDFFTINEKRRGGDSLELPEHQAGIAESVEHKITTGAMSFDQFFRESDKLSLYLSGQLVDRDSYYGALQSLQDYGKTKGFTYIAGAQYSANFEKSSLIGGIEYKNETLDDQKLGYPDLNNAQIINDTLIVPQVGNRIVADQVSTIYGAFAQFERTFNKLNISVGARLDRYEIEDKVQNTKKSGNVLSPRLTLKYDILKSLQARVSYSQGYRSPQIFDEDLHIETSGSRKVLHKNDPNLKQESSQSYMASLDFNKKVGRFNTGLLVEGFYTKLDDAFAGVPAPHPTEEGVVVYTRTNAESGATVRGVNLELNLIPAGTDFTFTGGFTIQKSEFEDSQEEFNEKSFYRTPNKYGYATIDWDFIKGFCFSATGNYTGSMLVPFYGVELTKPELRESDSFMDIGAKLSYQYKLNGASMQLFVGMKNIFNSYQNDFDSGINRDPGYLYGPSLPRTIYFGIKIGNLL